MAENYKHLYEQTKKMLTMYQDELIPGFRKKIEELEAKVAADNNVGSKWIPVTERLPDGRYDVLVLRTWWNERKPTQIGWYNEVAGSWYILAEDGYVVNDKVTHWMPLPEAPKGE